MSRLARIPDRGDMAPAAVQQRFGILLADFDELERRGFPERDPERADTASKPRTDGAQRFLRLFRELMAIPTAVDARTVVAAGSRIAL
jgi:hypothetical protein